MRVIEDHGMSMEIAEKVLGWKWVSFTSTPVRAAPGYPEKCRVREFVSPNGRKNLESHFDDVEDSDGTEPLAYCYCSSQGGGYPPPRILILVDEAGE